jgi:hypothetical protein
MKGIEGRFNDLLGQHLSIPIQGKIQGYKSPQPFVEFGAALVRIGTTK